MAIAYANLAVLATSIATCLVERRSARLKIRGPQRHGRLGPTAYERTATAVLCAFAIQGTLFADIQGGRLPAGLHSTLEYANRWCLECALFTTGFAFHGALCKKKEEHRALCTALCAASLSFCGFTLAWSIAGVPPSGRAACVRTQACLAGTIGLSSLEFVFCVKTIQYALRMRAQFISGLQMQYQPSFEDGAAALRPDHGLQTTEEAVEVMNARILSLLFVSICVLVALVWGLGQLNVQGRVRKTTCKQPACTDFEYLSDEASWAVGMLIVDWLCALFLVVPATFVSTVRRSSFLEAPVSHRPTPCCSWFCVSCIHAWSCLPRDQRDSLSGSSSSDPGLPSAGEINAHIDLGPAKDERAIVLRDEEADAEVGIDRGRLRDGAPFGDDHDIEESKVPRVDGGV